MKEKPTYGSRLRAFRLSLDAGELDCVPLAAMDRCFAPAGHRYHWRGFETITDSSPAQDAAVRHAVESVVGRLDVQDRPRAVNAIMAFVKGEALRLPWSEPPSWVDGACPVERFGRKKGTRTGPRGSPALMRPDPSLADDVVATARVLLQQLVDGKAEVEATVRRLSRLQWSSIGRDFWELLQLGGL